MKQSLRNIFLFLSLILAVQYTAVAQDGEQLNIGDVVQGEITNNNFEIEYSFSADESALIAIVLQPEDAFDGLSEPSIILLNSDYDVIETVDATLTAAALFYEIPESGDYYILASRIDGRAGDSIGAYTLNLFNVPILEPDQAVEGNVTSTNSVFFGVKLSSNFRIFYDKLGGDFSPSMTVNALEDEIFSDDNLLSLATLEGDRLVNGSIGIQPVENNLFVVALGEGLFDFNFTESTSKFRLELQVDE